MVHIFYSFLDHVKLFIFGKTIIKKFLVAKNALQCASSHTGLLLFKPGEIFAGLFGFVTTRWEEKGKDDLYHETLGPGVNVGSYPFPFGIKISLVSMRNPIFWSQGKYLLREAHDHVKIFERLAPPRCPFGAGTTVVQII